MNIQSSQTKVEPLKRIYFTIEGGTSETSMDITPGPISLDFIYGIGTEGLTPFEFLISDKAINEPISFSLQTGDIHSTFHQFPELNISLPQETDTAYFRVTVTKIETPSNREVVKAMAEGTDCGCGCGSCGCGCH